MTEYQENDNTIYNNILKTSQEGKRNLEDELSQNQPSSQKNPPLSNYHSNKKARNSDEDKKNVLNSLKVN